MSDVQQADRSSDGGPSSGVRKRIGPITLAPGIEPSQVFFYLVVTMAAAFSTAFASMMQPVILNDQLHIPVSQQGMLTGMLATSQQAAVLIGIGFAGVLADRIGRRTVLMMALAGFTLCLWAYPFIASIAALFVIRFAWGVASTGHTAGGATKMMDYPEEASRGKFISLITIVYAATIAAFNGLFASRLASWLKLGGLTNAEATRYAFWIISLIAIGGLFVAYKYFAKDAPPRLTAGSPRPGGGLRQVLQAWKDILAHARTNPRFAAVLLIASVIRTDGAVMAAFLGLWVVQAGRARGLDPIEAVKTVGLLLSLGSMTTLVSAPIFGWLSDRMDRLTMLVCAMAVMGAAFCSFGLIKDVFSPWMIGVVLLVALAESAQALSANALLGEAAPPHLRGSALGIFTWIGVVSVLIINIAAGMLFDRAGPAAAFIMEGMLCFAIFAAAIVLIRRQKATERAKAAA